MTTRSSVISVARCCQRCVGRAEINQLFIDYTMLAFTAHVAQTYGGMQPGSRPAHGGLAPWQVKRACERLESDLGGTLSLQQIAAEFDLSVSHFSRAFRISTGLPPHQWLLRQRVEGGQAVDDRSRLAAVRDCDIGRVRQSKPLYAGVLGPGRRQPRSMAPRSARRRGKQDLTGTRPSGSAHPSNSADQLIHPRPGD